MIELNASFTIMHFGTLNEDFMYNFHNNNTGLNLHNSNALTVTLVNGWFFSRSKTLKMFSMFLADSQCATKKTTKFCVSILFAIEVVVVLQPQYNTVVYSMNLVITRLTLGSHCLYFL